MVMAWDIVISADSTDLPLLLSVWGAFIVLANWFTTLFTGKVCFPVVCAICWGGGLLVGCVVVFVVGLVTFDTLEGGWTLEF